MDIIHSTKDILLIVIAFSVLLISVFFAWFLYYVIMMARQAYQIMKEMRERIKKVDEAISAFKEKVEHSTSYLLLIGEGIKKLVEIAREYSAKKNKSKNSKKK